MAFSFWKKMFGEEGSSSASDVKPEEVTEETSTRDVAVPPETEKAEPITNDQSEAVEKGLPESDDSQGLPDQQGQESPSRRISKEGLEGFVGYVARSLVDNPDRVVVSTLEKDRLSVIQIRCEKGDIGKIIGKNGKTISALRLLVSGAGGRIGLRMTVDVLD